MKNVQVHLPLLFVLTLAFSSQVTAQNWEFIKEKDGIKIYTGKETGKTLRSYKGVADINAPASQVFAMIEDVNNTDWWDKNLTQVKVLLYEKNKRAQYYLVYDLPWPVTDRDLCVDVTVTTNPLTGVSIIKAAPLTGVIPESDDMIRITAYWQTWTVTPVGKGVTHVELVGYVDPAGSIPEWVSNMIIVDSPVKVIGEVKDRFEKN